MSNQSEPYLSIVVASRNDDHGGNLLRRMQIFVDGLIAQCQRHRLDAELIIIEWNPPPDRPRLAQALRWPKDSSPCQVRIIEVPESLHRRFQHARDLPLFQMIGKNVGIRRARGQFVLATNIDILFSDELMAFFAARRLEPHRLYRIDRHDVMADVPYPAPLDEQLAYCRQHLLRTNTHEGSFNLTPAGDASPCSPDIVSGNTGIRLGRGWFAPENANGETFRWTARDAELIVEHHHYLPRTMSLDIEPGPGVGYRPFTLEIRDQAGTTLSRGTVSRRELVYFRLPETTSPAERYALHVESGGLPTPYDWRTLNFRVFDCQRVENWDEPSAGADNFCTRALPVVCKGMLEPNDIVASDVGVRFGPGWHAVEEGGSGRFRWAANDAALVVQATAAEQALTLAIEPGPGVGYQPFDLQIRNEDGQAVAACRVAGPSLATVRLPCRERKTNVFTFHLEGCGKAAPTDSRVLDFRVFQPIRRGRPLLAFARPLLMRKLVRQAGPWLRTLLAPLARWRARKRFGQTLPPPVTAPEPVAAAPNTPLTAEDVVSPAPLHLNASGDFTLLARQHWLDLKGYPEFEMYSLHIDSVLCYMAHHAGAKEVILPEPMRIYHIEHGVGSGWTPEGADRLMQRLQAQKIPVLSAGELFHWATQMRLQDAPIIFNGDAWGLGNDPLPETAPQPNAVAEPEVMIAPSWSNPCQVLGEKWHEIPTGTTRRSSRDLASLSDRELDALWRSVRDHETKEIAHRGWYHSIYTDFLRGKRVLEVGSGFGVDALSFARAGAHVTCVDVAETNLQLLRRLARHQGVTSIDFFHLDCFESLKNLPRDYDVIMCMGSMHHVPFGVAKEECRELLNHLSPQGRWLQLAYPKTRWDREGRLPFDRWGERTDGGAPWTEWYDLSKVMSLLSPARFETILHFEFHNSDFVWFDLQRVGD